MCKGPGVARAYCWSPWREKVQDVKCRWRSEPDAQGPVSHGEASEFYSECVGDTV